ncbi:unnamed protein product [Orchesella dallaii]|uniref:receptor protein-tyrosine kinase n=1 Tax=Orchesella dallaii TaxID=48710 RepID=A0ABP1Q1L3_9HEXA
MSKNLAGITSATLPLYIEVKNASSVAAGEDFEIWCETEQMSSVYYSLNISGPVDFSDKNKVIESFEIPGMIKNFNASKRRRQRYRIKNAVKEDSGTYNCSLTIHAYPKNSSTIIFAPKEIKVYDEGESFLEAATANENIIVRESTDEKESPARWVVNITSFPLKFEWSWKNPKGEDISFNKNKKYYFGKSTTEGEFILEVRDIKLEDTGNYPFTLKVPNSEERLLNLSLIVTASPKVSIESSGSKKYFMSNENYFLYCEVLGYPLPEAEWEFRTCETCETKKVAEINRTSIKNGFISTIEFQATTHGEYICSANNSKAESSVVKTVSVVDFYGDRPISITKPSEIVEGENVKITCALSKIYENLTWVKIVDDKEEPIPQDIEIETKETQWSRRKVLNIKNIKPSISGTYLCKSSGNASVVNDTIVVKVQSASPPHFTNSTTLINSSVELKEGHTMNLTCDAYGRPKPDLIWKWENHEEKDWPSDMQFSFSPDKSILFLTYVPFDAQGKFECTAKNSNGTASRFMEIYVKGKRHFNLFAIFAIAVLFIIVVICGLFIARFKYKQGEIKRFLKEISQEDFYKGAVENINPDLSVTDQAYLLPFDTKWEFPKERLKLGMQLGSGAFGRVVKADACGILDTEPITTVAVKMVKPNADESHFKALMSELKIMVHLGRHINVVNLLGACTKNLAKKKELFVIVEYCKYGSLLSYLHRHRRTFINQLDPARGVIDPNIYKPLDRNSQQSQAQRKPASNGYRFLEEFTNTGAPLTPTLQPIDLGNEADHGYPQSPNGFLSTHRSSTEHYVPDSQVESVCTGMSYLSNGQTTVGTDGTSKRRSSCGSQWQDHYRGDYQVRDVRPIKTTDLLCWAFQISRGMEYLASRKVLHGDLAARNVLLAEDNIVKICDFGLAKEMYKDYKYKKKSEGVLLPVKWMAIESIYYGVFSTQSDTWSFGVVLWELFTLGKTPYPGMDADERFYKRIGEGYRMEKPALAPSCVYDIMLECWSQEPTERPSFSTLVDRIGDMMEEGLRNHYVDLNLTYMRINQAELGNQPDYLSQMSRAEFATNSARPTPDRRYQNVPSPEVDSSGYLQPLHLQNLSQSPPASPFYQNVEQQTLEPNCTMLANNSGYMFVKVPVDHHQNFGTESNSQEEVSQPTCTLQINYSPDIKDVFGLRDDSTSPDRNSFTDNNMEGALNEVTCGAIVFPDDQIRGVDNMNYNHLTFKIPPQTPVPNGLEDNTMNGSINLSSSDNRRQRRQKNDSGLGSIDSNQFDSHHKPNSSDAPTQCSDIGKFQEPSTYVSHHNISSFS